MVFFRQMLELFLCIKFGWRLLPGSYRSWMKKTESYGSLSLKNFKTRKVLEFSWNFQWIPNNKSLNSLSICRLLAQEFVTRFRSQQCRWDKCLAAQEQAGSYRYSHPWDANAPAAERSGSNLFVTKCSPLKIVDLWFCIFCYVTVPILLPFNVFWLTLRISQTIWSHLAPA